MGVESMEGVGPETGGKMWDPLGLTGMASAKTLAWYRHAELKHGRVSMAAFAGWLWVTGGFPLFDAPYSFSGDTFESLGRDSFAAWDALPAMGKAQIILVMGALEFISETEKPHYMAGGEPGKVRILGQKLMVGVDVYPSPNSKEYQRLSEIKNGRLAMVGIMSVIASHYVPGSVPLLTFAGQ